MTRYADQMAAHNSALTALLLSIAVACATAAKSGTFLDVGPKCSHCPHTMVGGGCKLRMGVNNDA